MAKKKKDEEKLNYAAEVRQLRQEGPKPLYFLWGPEDYLCEQYLAELKSLCLPEMEDSFSYRRINGPELDPNELQQAVDVMPFLCERSFVEIRGVELNRLSNPDDYVKILKDIPDYCTVAFVQTAEFEPDGRLKLIRALRENAKELHFTEQSELLRGWIAKRFSAYGKSVDPEAAGRLMYVSGELMNRLIPEIEKIAAFIKGSRVTVTDVDAVANHIPEADVIEIADLIAQKDFNSAMSILSELMAKKDCEPIVILGMLGMQVRRLYGARIALDKKLGQKYLTDIYKIKNDYYANKLLSSAKGYTAGQLRQAVRICAETDYKMKSSGTDPKELLKEAFLRIAAGESDA